VPEDVEVTPDAAEEPIKAAEEPVEAAEEPVEAAEDTADAAEDTAAAAEDKAQDVADDTAAAAEEKAEDAVADGETEAEEPEAGLAEQLFDMDDEDAEATDDAADDKVRQPSRKLTKAPVKKTQSGQKRAASTAPTTTGRTTPWGFVRQAIGELRKVVWPSGDVVGQYFLVVLVFVLFVMFFVWGLDTLFGWGLVRIFR